METAFYIAGIVLAISAVTVSFIGLKSEKFPGKAGVVVILAFAAGAIAASTFVVIYSQEHEEHREHELEHANEVIEGEQHGGPDKEAEEDDILKEDEEGAESQEGAAGGKEAGGTGGTLEVVANESALEYEQDSLETEAGEVEIDFKNPSAIPHDVRVEGDGEDLGGTEIISESEESATIELEAGEYVFFCSVPGHREAGMEGPLTAK